MSKEKTENKKVATYLRVSSDQQDVKMQREEIATEIKTKGYELVDEYADEAIKGTTENRVELSRLMDDAQRGRFDTVICYKIDRLARDVRLGLNILHEIEKTGVCVSILKEPMLNTDAPAYKMLRTAILMGAEMEYESIKQRTRSSKFAWITSNKWPSPGHVPFGYKLTPNYQLEIVPDRAEIVKRVFRMYKDENQSVRQIVVILNEEKIPSGTPNGWKKDRIQDMLGNPVYLGALPIKGKKLGPIHTFHCEPIISEETFNKIKRKRIERIERSRRNTSRDYPFQGLLRCELCGYPLHCITSTNSYTENYCYGFTRRPFDGKNIKDKRCSGRGCGRISERNIVESVYGNIVKFFAKSSAQEIKEWLVEGEVVEAEEGNNIEGQIKQEQAELNLINAKADKYIDLFTDINQPISVQEKCKKMLANLEHTIKAKTGKIHSLKQSLLSIKEKEEKAKEEGEYYDPIHLAVLFKKIFETEKKTPPDYTRRYKLVVSTLPFINVVYVNLQTGHLQIHMRAEHEKMKIMDIPEDTDSNGGSSNGGNDGGNVIANGIKNGISDGNSDKLRLSERTQVKLIDNNKNPALGGVFIIGPSKSYCL
jgi:site-specific DNA recombinase